MGHNLPDRVNPGDPDAPWNQDHPEPSFWCDHCGAGFMNHYAATDHRRPVDTTVVELNDLQAVVINDCPNCGEPLVAELRSHLVPFLRWLREDPDGALEQVEDYSVLREYHEALDRERVTHK